jgi:transcriptional regulator with XRE-family HTH domain
MITREELLRSSEYWFENAQNDLYGQVIEYMDKEGINQNQLATRLGVSKGYVSQILKGEFNYTLKKLIEISLAIGKAPQIEYKRIEDVIAEDERTHFFSIEENYNRMPFDGPTLTLNKSSKESNIQLSATSEFINYSKAS